MRYLVGLVVVAGACVTPSQTLAPHDAARSAQSAAAARAAVASVLSADDPLDTKPCPAPGAQAQCSEQEVTALPEQHMVDPMCGMTLTAQTANGGKVTHAGKTYHFCSASCRERFVAKAHSH